jgi:hypothetical protein
MRELFRGWRRKLGCVTLVMALMLMVGWIRSRVVHEGLGLQINEDTTYSLVSRDDTLHLLRFVAAEQEAGQQFFQWVSQPRPANASYITDRPDTTWRWQAGGFGLSDLALSEGDFTVLTAPYWFPTGILTILSVWLLLSKPRPQPQPTTPSRDHA